MDPDRPAPEAGGSGTASPAAPSGSRTPCPRCCKSVGSYCADCVLVLDPAAPRGLRLPVRLHIVQHGETNARSTALHAALLAPDDVEVHRHAGSTTSRRCDPLALQLPSWDPATTAVLFPEGPDTPAVGAAACPPFDRLVVLESNWRKARGLLRHPCLAGLRRVQLPREVCSTEFEWRRGAGSFRGAVDEGMSSIEAIAHACRLLGSPGTVCDSLLHFFRQQQAFVKKRGALPTSKQELRALQKKQRSERRQDAAAAAGARRQQAAAERQVAAPEEAAQPEEVPQGAAPEEAAQERPAAGQQQAAAERQQAAPEEEAQPEVPQGAAQEEAAQDRLAADQQQAAAEAGPPPAAG